ncbi:sugar ABC transporter substrate-binding protein [Vallitaleaceae bacterium 9-2]
MRRQRYVLSFICLIIGLFLLIGCQKKQEHKVVGISMPTKSSERWLLDAKYTVLEFEAIGYETKLAFAEDVVGNQASQIDNFLDEGVDLLVIAPIDSTSLTEVLKRAKELKVPIVSYDRLIMNSDAVDIYVSFDNERVGELQGNYIIDHLDFSDGQSKYIELFAGSPDDNNTYYFFDGAMKVLRPYIEDGRLVVKSKQFDVKEVNTLRWDKMIAKSRMTSLLNNYYAKERIDAVLAPYDGVSRGVIEALLESGYTLDTLPIVTGQDAELTSIKLIEQGVQSMTVFKDVRELAKKTVEISQQILEQKDISASATQTYHNGVKDVMTVALDVYEVNQDNWEEVLVGKKYYTRQEVLDE